VNVSIGLAFIAGLASFLSPCVFSLVPAYIGYLSGRSAAATDPGQSGGRWETLAHGFAFVLGFSTVFVLLGLMVSALGRFLYEISPVLAKIGGIVVILFGIHMTGIIRIPFLDYDLRPQNRLDQSRSYLSSWFMGVFFSAGWSPCVGPVLGAILTLALSGDSIQQGVQLLVSYSAGLAIPFLAAALGIGWVTRIIRKNPKITHYVEVVMGCILILVGILLFLGIFEQLAGLGQFFNLGV
jgi:cytochrome c-type biogenesis protein